MSERAGTEFMLWASAVEGAHDAQRAAVVLSLAAPDGSLMALKVDVLDARGERLLEAESSAVEDLAEETEGRFEKSAADKKADKKVKVAKADKKMEAAPAAPAKK